MKIKLSCSSCKGEVVYEKEKSEDNDKANARLHAADCPYKKDGPTMSYVAEHGIPVESEVLT